MKLIIDCTSFEDCCQIARELVKLHPSIKYNVQDGQHNVTDIIKIGVMNIVIREKVLEDNNEETEVHESK